MKIDKAIKEVMAKDWVSASQRDNVVAVLRALAEENSELNDDSILLGHVDYMGHEVPLRLPHKKQAAGGDFWELAKQRGEKLDWYAQETATLERKIAALESELGSALEIPRCAVCNQEAKIKPNPRAFGMVVIPCPCGQARWIPCSERTPLEGRWVICHRRGEDFAFPARWCPGHWLSASGSRTEAIDVTHWMALPEPLKEAT